MINNQLFEELFPDIDIIRTIAITDLKQLIAAFDQLTDCSTLEKVPADIIRMNPSGGYQDVHVRAIISLAQRMFALARKNSISRQNVAMQLGNYYSRLNLSELSLTDQSKEIINKLLLVCGPSINLSRIAKPYGLYEELSMKFKRAKIMTDIRPVFGETEETMHLVIDSLIFHTLQISYQIGDEIKEFQVHLTDTGLNELQGEIARAKLKEIDLEQRERSTGTNVIRM